MKMTTNLTKLILTVAIAFFTLSVFAQNPDFTYKLGGKVTYRKLTDAGVLVVANGDGLVGIKPGASEPHFNFKDYGRVKPEELDFVPMSPYLVVSQGGFMTAKKTVIDFVSGKKMFGTEDNGWKLTNRCDVMLPQNKLVVLGLRKGGAMAVGLYDLVTGKEEGLVELNNPKKVGMASAIPQFSGKPAIIGDGLIVPTTKNLMQIDVKSGKTNWTTKVDDITWVTSDKTGTEIYAFEETQGGDTKIYKVKNDGTILWEKGVKVKGKVSRFEILPQGLAIVSDVDNSGKSGIAKLAAAASESKIGFLNAKDGSDLWEKAPKTKGYVQHFYVLSDGILFGIQEGGINKISFEGNTLFKKPLKTGENIHTMALTPKGLIYITDTDADIINLSTGESIWNKPIKYKKAAAVSSTYDPKNKRYLISTGEEMVAINEGTGDISTLAKYKFEEKEVPGTLSVREGGLLLTSDQNVMMLNFDGSKKFHEYYKSPGRSTFGKVMGGVMAVASTTMTMAASMKAGANKTGFGSVNDLSNYNDAGKEAKLAADMFANIAGASFAYMSTRFKSTAATQNYQFILTKLDDGVGLARVSKDTGKKDKEVVLKDKKPEYEVDEFGGFLYYQKDGSTLYAFDLRK